MSELWTVTLRFRGAHAPPVSLFFAGEAAARKAFERVAVSWPVEFPRAVIPDHYGSEMAIFAEGPLEAVILQDTAKAFEVQMELELKQAIAQNRANRRAAGDPELKFVTGQSAGIRGRG